MRHPAQQAGRGVRYRRDPLSGCRCRRPGRLRRAAERRRMGRAPAAPRSTQQVSTRLGPPGGDEDTTRGKGRDVVGINPGSWAVIRELHDLVCPDEGVQVELVHTRGAGDEVLRRVDVGAQMTGDDQAARYPAITRVDRDLRWKMDWVVGHPHPNRQGQVYVGLRHPCASLCSRSSGRVAARRRSLYLAMLTRQTGSGQNDARAPRLLNAPTGNWTVRVPRRNGSRRASWRATPQAALVVEDERGLS